MLDENPTEPLGWRRPTWPLLLIAASVAGSLALACATPFAAFAAVAACTLPRRDAYALALGVWLANQAVGFGYLHYPRTADCIAWGAALGFTSLLSTLAARLAARGGFPVREVSAFLAAYGAYEVALIAFSLRLGGIEYHTVAIQGPVFANQAVAMVGLLILERIGVAVGIAPSLRNPPPLVTRPS